MAFRDARQLEQDAGITTDLCIIGAGAAGITIADGLDGRKFRVLVLESGGFEEESANQALYRGERIGMPYPSLERTRLRYFGGTTNHWAGWCRPPRHADLAGRDWIPDSGWPLSMEELDPYLIRAQRLCDLDPSGFETSRSGARGRPLDLDPSTFETLVTRFSPPTRFARRFRDSLAASENVDVFLNANLVALGTSDNGRLVERLHCRTLEGRHFTVSPRYVVLATGGIENARILLASGGITGRGIGNEYDRVGRCFMDHFKFHVGTLDPHRKSDLDFYQRQAATAGEFKGVLGFTERILERYRISPAHIEFHADTGEDPGRRFRIDVRIDPAPNHDSRIMLDRVVDRFGMPRVVVALRFSGFEQRTFVTAMQLLKDGLERARIGDLDMPLVGGGEPLLDDARVTATGFHHMGATRMADHPARGVVDPNCRVHSMGNLYIAGCSVFPGYEGYPTLTLVALAARLGDYLADRFS